MKVKVYNALLHIHVSLCPWVFMVLIVDRLCAFSLALAETLLTQKALFDQVQLLCDHQ